MKIAFFSEGGYVGKVPRNNNNMRTDTAWVCALNADHYPIPHLFQETVTVKHKYDIGIIIIPKTTGGNTGTKKNPFDREVLARNNYPLVDNLKHICSKVLVMQESTHWDWQEDSATILMWYYSQLCASDGVLCHNDIDVPYFQGLTNKPAYIFPTLMIEDMIESSDEKLDRVFVAGNWHTTYRGFDAWNLALHFDLPITGFKSGKFKEGEGTGLVDVSTDKVYGLVDYLPWMPWVNFMKELSKHKYGVQCYQASAGQFPLNCAYFGIPCVGYNDVNTQRELFPELSVERGDIVSAKKIITDLKHDEELYDRVSINSKNKYTELYSENKFLKNWNLIEEEVLNGTK